MEGKVKTVTIKREGNCWSVIMVCEVQACQKLPYTDLPIGIDMGLLHFMCTAHVERRVSTKTSVYEHTNVYTAWWCLTGITMRL
jgi:transposase